MLTRKYIYKYDALISINHNVNNLLARSNILGHETVWFLFGSNGISHVLAHTSLLHLKLQTGKSLRGRLLPAETFPPDAVDQTGYCCKLLHMDEDVFMLSDVKDG